MGIIDNWGLKITRVTVKLLGWITMFFSPRLEAGAMFPKESWQGRPAGSWQASPFAIISYLLMRRGEWSVVEPWAEPVEPCCWCLIGAQCSDMFFFSMIDGLVSDTPWIGTSFWCLNLIFVCSHLLDLELHSHIRVIPLCMCSWIWWSESVHEGVVNEGSCRYSLDSSGSYCNFFKSMWTTLKQLVSAGRTRKPAWAWMHAAHLLQSYELLVGSAKHKKHLMVFLLGPSWPYKMYNVQQNPTSSVISMSFPGCFRHFQEMCLLFLTLFPWFSHGFPTFFATNREPHLGLARCSAWRMSCRSTTRTSRQRRSGWANRCGWQFSARDGWYASLFVAWLGRGFMRCEGVHTFGWIFGSMVTSLERWV